MATHDDIERLLPWYVNGTLNEAEMDRVNRHLHRCQPCSDRLEREVRFARSMRSPPAGLERVSRRDAGWPELVALLPPRRPLRRSAPATLAALAVAIAGVSFLAGQRLREPAYSAMTAPVPADGPVVQIVFEPTTPERVIRQVVLDSGGTLIAGPTAIGLYRIALPPAADSLALVQRLQRLPDVRWVAQEEP